MIFYLKPKFLNFIREKTSDSKKTLVNQLFGRKSVIGGN
jgi:hypothetical protein